MCKGMPSKERERERERLCCYPGNVTAYWPPNLEVSFSRVFQVGQHCPGVCSFRLVSPGIQKRGGGRGGGGERGQ
jgi:hypothetical protein